MWLSKEVALFLPKSSSQESSFSVRNLKLCKLADQCVMQNSRKLMLKALNEFPELKKIEIDGIQEHPETAFRKFVAGDKN